MTLTVGGSTGSGVTARTVEVAFISVWRKADRRLDALERSIFGSRGRLRSEVEAWFQDVASLEVPDREWSCSSMFGGRKPKPLCVHVHIQAPVPHWGEESNGSCGFCVKRSVLLVID